MCGMDMNATELWHFPDACQLLASTLSFIRVTEWTTENFIWRLRTETTFGPIERLLYRKFEFEEKIKHLFNKCPVFLF